MKVNIHSLFTVSGYPVKCITTRKFKILGKNEKAHETTDTPTTQFNLNRLMYAEINLGIKCEWRLTGQTECIHV